MSRTFSDCMRRQFSPSVLLMCVSGRSKPCDNRRGLANDIPSCLGDLHFFLLTVLRFQWGGLGVTMGGLGVERPGRKAGCVKHLDK